MNGENLPPTKDVSKDRVAKERKNTWPVRLLIGLLAVLVAGGILSRFPDIFFSPRGGIPTEGEPKTCNITFVTLRQVPKWYRKNGFGEPTNCRTPKESKTAIVEGVSVPVYWVIISERDTSTTPNQGWSRTLASQKMREAVDYFARYCITVPTYEVPLKSTEKRALRTKLRTANAQGHKKYRAEVEKTSKKLWTRMGKPGKYLLVMFVDKFNAVQYWQRIDRVAGNFDKIPVILVPDPPDSGSNNIISHELVHGFGKVLNGKSTRPFADGINRKNTWDEGGCGIEMGNAQRNAPTAPMNKLDTAPLDWGSYWQFQKNANVK